MIIVLERGTTEEEQREVLAALEQRGLRGRVLGNLRKPVIHVLDGPTALARKLRELERVEALVRTSGPRIRREGRRFFPYHFINWCSATLVAIGLLVLLAGFFPPGLGAEIDPHSPATDAGAPWYLRAPLAVVRLAPTKWSGWLGLGLFLAVVYFLPRLDRTRGAGIRARAPVLLIGLVVGVLWLVLTFRGPAG